jgi:hypothetical protein
MRGEMQREIAAHMVEILLLHSIPPLCCSVDNAVNIVNDHLFEDGKGSELD